MKSSKNLLTIVLMTASMILLLLLEFFWLKNAYRSEKTNFTRTSYFIFQNSVLSLQEKQYSINPVLPDLPPVNQPNQIRNTEKPGKPEKSIRVLRFLISRLYMEKFPNTLNVRITGDSISTNNLDRLLKEELIKAGINLDYRLSVNPGTAEPSWVYSVHFENVIIYALEKVMPQVLFCITLTLLIILSFYLMYRSIRINQRLIELKNDFISNITHELKTPVATVSVAIEALKNFNVLNNPEKAAQYLDIALKELNRLDLMTDRILSNTVSENKGIEFKNEPVNLKNLADHVLDSMQLVFEKRKAEVNFIAEDSDMKVQGSPVHLMDVMYNLIENALKYGQPGVKIDISIFSENRHIVFSIKDDGPGILPEYQKKIFEKFGRIPGGDAYNKGYGLGLYYVKQVVESHHGSIHLDSKPGKGSTFSIRLPKADE